MASIMPRRAWIWLVVFLLPGPIAASVKECDEYRDVVRMKTAWIFLDMAPTIQYAYLYNCSVAVDLILGGEEAKKGEFPHHALLGYDKLYGVKTGRIIFNCGGSLISDHFVLTAAHCFSHDDPVVVRLGEHDTAQRISNRHDFKIANITSHPLYRNSRSYHDIALVRLDEMVRFSLFIRPACLWTEPTLNISRAQATGFGHTSHNGVLSEKMMKVTLDFFPPSDCEVSFLESRFFSDGFQDSQFCVGSLIGGKDTCQGDSGGPLQTVIDRNICIHHIIALTSIGKGCGVGQSKAVYTGVQHYLDWIEQIVWPDNQTVSSPVSSN